jgi:hypothetical protein
MRRIRLSKADARPAHFEGSRVGGHDDDHMAEIRLAPVVVGQRAVIHDLQQQIEHIRMRLFDFIEQQHAVRMLGNGLGQQSALIESHVARRRADEARHGMPLHVLRHVEAHEFHAHGDRQLPGHFGLADARRTGEQEEPTGLALIAQARSATS